MIDTIISKIIVLTLIANFEKKITFFLSEKSFVCNVSGTFQTK